VPVKIDPNNPNNVVLDINESSVSGGGLTENIMGKNISNQDYELISNGINAQAKIIDIKNTGKTENINSVIQMTYEVQIPNKLYYTLTKEAPMSMQAFELAKGFIGKNVPAKVHPNDNNKVGLEFRPLSM